MTDPRIPEYLSRSAELSAGIPLILAVSVFWMSGFGGFVYETVFYRINNGVLTRRGNCFGPWISIYCFGGLLVLASCWELRGTPALLFLASGALCSVLEFSVGYVLHRFYRIRLWDYRKEIWNFGNIGGYICLRSALIFAASGFIVFYGMLPLLLWLRGCLSDQVFCILTAAAALLCVLDLFYNYLLAKVLGTRDASAFYAASGLYGQVADYRLPGQPDTPASGSAEPEKTHFTKKQKE